MKTLKEIIEKIKATKNVYELIELVRSLNLGMLDEFVGADSWQEFADEDDDEDVKDILSAAIEKWNDLDGDKAYELCACCGEHEKSFEDEEAREQDLCDRCWAEIIG